ncbi:MAG: hypothetical protein U1C97_03520, partial [Candidatus Gracilibacteria bacterium]|nr:hypothetical protein [Candidatus Gracilibacteria bacterium]
HTNPTIEAEYDLGGDGNKIFAVKDDAVYVTSNSNSSSVSIFPFPGDAYATEGIYQSPPFDTASDTTSWHSFHWEGALGISTTVGFQIRTADSESNLNTAQWAGPDGTIESYYTDTDSIIQLSPSATGTRWMQYQIVLTGDSTETPEVSLVRFQYSP